MAADASPDTDPLLRRLNARGFRLVMLADVVWLALVLVGGMVVRFGWAWPSYPMSMYVISFTVTLTVFVASLYFGGLYERDPRLGAPPALPRAGRQTLAAGGLVALLILALTGLARDLLGVDAERVLPLPVGNLVALIALGAPGVAANRRLAHWRRTRNEGPPRVLVAGEPGDLAIARRHLAQDPARATVAGETEYADDLPAEVEATGATDVLLVTGGWVDALYPRGLDALQRQGTPVLLRVSARETMYGLERVREVAGMPFVLLRAQTMAVSRARFKRFFDLVVCTVTAPLWLPLLGLVALYQLFAVGRPVLFWQDRVGTDGRIFAMVKFRTMVRDAEADGRGARLAEEDDPRIVPACRWLRSTRLDELPQVINVLRGEMSLVGPRPERPELTIDLEHQIAGYTRRYALPPGMTGLAQIHGRYHTDPEYKLGYDLQYLVNWSPVLDLEILARTVWVVLTRRL